ncbi:MAG TPA: heme exporter protein CcmB [Polyangiaceae bacterium]|jgi:heme exporter protein B|nr:heme exporter protein CcmB [Polyangiaceae bacterium]
MQDAAVAREPAGAAPRRLPGWSAQTLIVLRKDLMIEARTGEVVVTSGFFAVLVVVLASLSLFGGPASARLVASGVIWLSVTFAAVLALGKSWQREREEGALDGLIVAPLSRSALFVGKLLGILTFLLLISAVVIPLTALFFSLDLGRYGLGLALIALVALPGVAAAGTLFGAMTVRTGARDLLLAIVLFPLVSPTLLAAVAGTRELFTGAPLSELGDYFRLMGVFDVVFTAGGVGLFGTLVER